MTAAIRKVLSAELLPLLLLLLLATSAIADELEPRRWAHLPVNTNFAGAGYAHTSGTIDFDPVLLIENAEMELHTIAAKYIRTFSLFDQSARIDLTQAYQEGHWDGLLDGAPAKISRTGWSDTLVRFAVNLYGAPPLKGKQYADYRAGTESGTIVGAGLSLQLPTGNYMKDRLINLGSNRYTLRPQLGVVHTRGRWSLEATGVVAIYSANDAFYNGNRLEQAPLYTVHGHLVYLLRPGVWASASAGYDYGGRSTLNGVNKDDRKRTLLWAASCGFPLSRHLGVKLAYLSTRTQVATGTDSDSLIIGMSAFW